MQEKSGAGMRLFLSKITKGAPGLMSPSDQQIAVNSTYAFTKMCILVLPRDLGLNQVTIEILPGIKTVTRGTVTLPLRHSGGHVIKMFSN